MVNQGPICRREKATSYPLARETPRTTLSSPRLMVRGRECFREHTHLLNRGIRYRRTLDPYLSSLLGVGKLVSLIPSRRTFTKGVTRMNTRIFKDKKVLLPPIGKENLSDIVDSDDGIDMDEKVAHTNIDAMSNES
jgi:hypothetical protein